MAQLTIKINGYAYTVGCEDGQEYHAQAMAQEVDNRISSIKALGGQSGEARLLVLAALLMADELHDLGIELATMRRAGAAGAVAAVNGIAAAPAMASPQDAAKAAERADRLARLARRAEEIAATLERT